jgi:hypothetical protein
MRVLLGLGGLVGLLIVAFFIISMQAETASTVIPAGEQARKQAEQIAGRGPNGRPASESITLEPVYRNGQLQSLVVRNIDATGPMAAYFGLKVGDQITQIGPLEVRGNDAETAKAEVAGEYQRQWPLVIQRNNQEMKLPAATPPSAAQANQPAPQPAAAPSSENRTDHRSPLQRQLDTVRNIPTH